MNRAYDEIMDKIEVSGEMRERVLKNVEAACRARRGRVLRFNAVKKYVSLAACAALILFAALTFSKADRADTGLTAPGAEVSDESDMLLGTAPGGIEDCASLAELSEKTELELKELDKLPFEVESTEYTSYWGELAQISYSGGGESLVYRVSRGGEDNSGDYNEYENIKSLDIDGVSVTLKGNGEAYSLAVWQSGGLSFSLSAEGAMSEETLREIISAAIA